MEIDGKIDEDVLDAELSRVTPMFGGSALPETEEAIELMFRVRDEDGEALSASHGVSEDLDQFVSQSQGPGGHASPSDRPQQLDESMSQPMSRSDPAPALPALYVAAPSELPPPSHAIEDPASHEDNDAIWDDLADYLEDRQDEQVI